MYICLGVQLKICYLCCGALFLLHACFLELTMHPQYNQLFQLRIVFFSERAATMYSPIAYAVAQVRFIALVKFGK
jgi:hypothetical protein